MKFDERSVEKKGGVAMYRQRRDVSASYEEFILAAPSKEVAARAGKNVEDC